MQKKERMLHHATVSVFCKPYEDYQEVLRGLDALSPVPSAQLLATEPHHDPERPHTVHYTMQDISLTVQRTPSDDGVMTIYTLFFKRMSWTNDFAKQLSAALTVEQRHDVARDPHTILDDEGKLSLRLEKASLTEGTLRVVDGGSCYQVKASVAAYPKTQERIAEVVKRIFS